MADKKNTFLAVEMSIADLDYYKEPGFKHFTFQQVMLDGDKNDDAYTLGVYAVNDDGNIMNDDQIVFNGSITSSLTVGKRVQFANIVLRYEDLEQIFPDHIPNTPITLTPIKTAKYPHFISYSVQGGAGLTTIIIDPSPPAK